MGDDSSRSIVKSLKKEWALFLEAFQAEESDTEVLGDGTLQVMDLNKVREMTKALIEDRKKLNQKLEVLSKELDLNTAKLESLRLVGADEDETYNRIQELNDLGQSISEAMAKLDKKLRETRGRELEIQEA